MLLFNGNGKREGKHPRNVASGKPEGLSHVLFQQISLQVDLASSVMLQLIAVKATDLFCPRNAALIPACGVWLHLTEANKNLLSKLS